MVMELGDLRTSEDHLTERLASVRTELAQRNAQTRELPDLERRVLDMRGGAPYRAEDLTQLETKLAAARDARGKRARLRIEEAALLKESETLRRELERNGIRKVTLPILENVRIAAPCDANWAEMEGDADVRFCKHCSKSVFNLSMMSREEAESVLLVGDGQICLRLYRRDDGTVLTDDCPVGAAKQRFWRRATGLAAAGLIAAALGLAYKHYIQKQIAMSGMETVTMGLAPR